MSKEIYDLSEEEFAKLTPADIRTKYGNDDEDTDTVPADNVDDADDVSDDEDQDEDEQGNPDEETDDESEDGEANPEDESDEESEDDATSEDEGDDANPTDENVNDSKGSKKPKTKPADKTEANVEEVSEVPAEQLKDFFAAVTGKFRAHGAEYSFSNPQEIISLMQKGIDYNNKMNAIAQHRGVTDLLKEHDLLDATKLSFLLDLHNKKPEAIAKLIKDAGIDAYELDEAKAEQYQETQVDISGRKSALSDVIEHYKGDEIFTNVFEEAKTWDAKSQEVLVNNPALFHTLYEQVKSGTFAKVMEVVKRENALGRTSGSILTDYDYIGQQLFASPSGGSAQVNQKVTAPAPKVVKKVDANIEQRRKAATKTVAGKSAAPKKTFKSPMDIFNLSAEEFDKINPAMLRETK